MFGRLSAYLARLFALDAMALFSIALFLLFLVQCLKSSELISAKGQDLLTLGGHAALALPSVGIVFFYVCLGIGLARGLRALQTSHELIIIHTSRTTRALIGAVITYAAIGSAAVLVLTNFVEPATSRQLNEWTAQISADVVSRSLRPQKFSEVVPGVTIGIGDRRPGGQLIDFFADDARPGTTHKTYLANTATVAIDNDGYVIQLRDGSIQYMTEQGNYSHIAFSRYDLAMESLTGPVAARDVMGEINSYELVTTALANGVWDDATVKQLGKRVGEAIRVLAMCLFVAGLATFPSGKRTRRGLPLEIVVLVSAFVERGLSSYILPDSIVPVVGSFIFGAIGLLLLIARFQPLRTFRSRRRVIA